MQSPPAPSISPTLSRTHSQPPPRTKSSSALSSHSGRPKRNKSSSSLVSHGHGHHPVQFTHHGKKVAHKRNGSSGGRKPGIEFGFTSLVPTVETSASAVDDEDEDEERDHHEGEEEERGGRSSAVQRRGSQGGGAGSSKSRERERERDRDRLRSRERNEARMAQADEARRVAGEMEERRKEVEMRKAAMLHALSPPPIIGSAASGSDWESATDSPRPPTKPLPGTSLRVESGLGKVMRVAPQADQLKVVPQEVEREASPSRPTGRATFQLADDDELSSTPPDTPTHLAPSQRDRITRRPPPQAQLPLRQTTPPPNSPRQRVNPPPPVRAATAPPQQSTLAFPTTSGPSSPPSPVNYRPRQARKSSNASLASIASTRSLAASFHGLMGPPSPAFRRTASSLAPTVDRGTVATGQLFEPTGMGHRRNGSMSSLRSLRSVVEAAESGPSGLGERRTSTMGAMEGREAVRRLRLANLAASSDAGGSGGGGAAAALANLGAGTRPVAAKRSASGYFATLRGLANISSLTPPSPVPSPPATRLSIPPPPSSLTTIVKPRVTPRLSQPVISKFIEPTPHSAYSSSPSHFSSVSPLRTRGPLFARQSQQGSSSTASLGAMSRTQQKALLARDAPYWANGSAGGGSGIADPIASGSAGFYSQFPTLPPPASIVATKSRSKESGEDKARQDGMHKWAMGLVREAERIERQYRSVQKWRDPLGESLERVLPKVSGKKVIR